MRRERRKWKRKKKTKERETRWQQQVMAVGLQHAGGGHREMSEKMYRMEQELRGC